MSTGGLDNPAIRLVGSGPLYGVVLRRVDEPNRSVPHVFGALRGPVAHFCASGACGGEALGTGDDRKWTFTTESGDSDTRETLPPGRYRLHLVTEGTRPVEVTLRLDGLDGRAAYEADTPSRAIAGQLPRVGATATDQQASFGRTASLATHGLLTTITLVRTEQSAGTDIVPCFYEGGPPAGEAYGPTCPSSGGNITTVASPIPYIEHELAATIQKAGQWGIGAYVRSASPAPRAGSYGLWLPWDDGLAPRAGVPSDPSDPTEPAGSSAKPSEPAGTPATAPDRPRRLLTSASASADRGCVRAGVPWRVRLRFTLARPGRVTAATRTGRVVLRRRFGRGRHAVTLSIRRSTRCGPLRMVVRARAGRVSDARRLLVRFTRLSHRTAT
jgi:hypothetical protein